MAKKTRIGLGEGGSPRRYIEGSGSKEIRQEIKEN